MKDVRKNECEVSERMLKLGEKVQHLLAIESVWRDGGANKERPDS